MHEIIGAYRTCSTPALTNFPRVGSDFFDSIGRIVECRILDIRSALLRMSDFRHSISRPSNVEYSTSEAPFVGFSTFDRPSVEC